MGCRGCVAGEAELLRREPCCPKSHSEGELPHGPTVRGVLPQEPHSKNCPLQHPTVRGVLPQAGTLWVTAPTGNNPMELNTYKQEPPACGAGLYGAQLPQNQSPGVIEQKLPLQQSRPLKNSPYRALNPIPCSAERPAISGQENMPSGTVPMEGECQPCREPPYRACPYGSEPRPHRAAPRAAPRAALQAGGVGSYRPIWSRSHPTPGRAAAHALLSPFLGAGGDCTTQTLQGGTTTVSLPAPSACSCP